MEHKYYRDINHSWSPGGKKTGKRLRETAIQGIIDSVQTTEWSKY